MTDIEAKTLGQICGLAAMIDAVVQVLPDETQSRVRALMMKQCEAVLAQMLGDDQPHADTSREGLEMIRDSFIEGMANRGVR